MLEGVLVPDAYGKPINKQGMSATVLSPLVIPDELNFRIIVSHHLSLMGHDVPSSLSSPDPPPTPAETQPPLRSRATHNHTRYRALKIACRVSKEKTSYRSGSWVCICLWSKSMCSSSSPRGSGGCRWAFFYSVPFLACVDAQMLFHACILELAALQLCSGGGQ